MSIRLIPLLVGLCLSCSLSAQTLWAPKAKPAQYSPPHKPHTKLADLEAKHKGKKMWRELIVDDDQLKSEYLLLPPGFKHPRALHPDTRTWWVVMRGEVKFDIETVGAFTGRNGSMVQAPMQTLFSYEVAGNQPALIFETNIAGAKTIYADQTAVPQIKGFEWIPVTLNNRQIAMWQYDNKPHVTFEEVAEKLEKGVAKGTQRIVQDDRGAANFIYGYEKNLPPIDPKARGHYHPESSEYWLIMKNQIRYPVEQVGVIIAEEGDVVYVPKSTFHAPRWYGPGPSCRLAMNGYPYIAHLFDAEPH